MVALLRNFPVLQPLNIVKIAEYFSADMESGAKNAASRTISFRLHRDSRARNSNNRIDSEGMVLENYANFKRSGVPERVMWFDGVKWVDLVGEVLEVVKLGFREGKAVVEGVVGGEKCLFDFLRMELLEFGSGRKRSVAWIDVVGNCFFPKLFGVDDGFDEDVRIGIDVRLVDESKVTKRKREEHVELDPVEVGKVSKSSCESQSGSNRGGRNGGDVLGKRALAEADVEVAKWPNCRLIREDERFFEVMKHAILERVRIVDPDASVKSVYHFVRTGGTARARDLAFKSSVKLNSATRGNENVVYAWYATTSEGVGRIIADGFSVTRDVEDSYGVGVYLSHISLPHLSMLRLEPDENGEKLVILCRVLLGKVEKVEAGSKQRHPSSSNFDNGVDDLKNPRRYIIWCTNMNTHILPQCIVSFKLPGLTSGVMGASAVKKSVRLSDFMSKLPDYLPPAKINEINELWTAYKAGRLTKEDAMKGIQALASDRILWLAFSACPETTNKL